MKAFWDRLPLTAKAASGAIAFVAALLLLLAILHAMLPSSTFDTIAGPLQFVILIAAILLLRWHSTRELGGAEQAKMFLIAARTGTVPAGADREKWRDSITLQLTRHERIATSTWRFIGVPVVLLVGLLATMAVWGSLSARETLIVAATLLPIFTLAVVVLTLAMRKVGRTQRPRLERLAEALEKD